MSVIKKKSVYMTEVVNYAYSYNLDISKEAKQNKTNKRDLRQAWSAHQ